VEPVTDRALTMRELLTRARERFGPEAARYKTREELKAALGLGPLAPSPEGGAPTSAAAEPGSTREAPRPPVDGAREPGPPGPAPREPVPPLVVRDFFMPRRG
jgi:hypothetical protein